MIGHPRWLRTLGGPRRVVGALLAAVVATQLGRAATAAPPPSETVVVAAHDLPAGLAIGPDDVRSVRRAVADVPDGALPDPVGAVPSAPVAAGEPVLTTRVSQAPDDLLRVPVRLDDGAVASLVAAGDRVDVLAAPTTTDAQPFTSAATVVADDLLVDRVITAGVATGDGVLLEVRATRTQAEALAGAATTGRLSIAVEPAGS